MKTQFSWKNTLIASLFIATIFSCSDDEELFIEKTRIKQITTSFSNYPDYERVESWKYNTKNQLVSLNTHIQRSAVQADTALYDIKYDYVNGSLRSLSTYYQSFNGLSYSYYDFHSISQNEIRGTVEYYEGYKQKFVISLDNQYYKQIEFFEETNLYERIIYEHDQDYNLISYTIIYYRHDPTPRISSWIKRTVTEYAEYSDHPIEIIPARLPYIPGIKISNAIPIQYIRSNPQVTNAKVQFTYTYNENGNIVSQIKNTNDEIRKNSIEYENYQIPAN